MIILISLFLNLSAQEALVEFNLDKILLSQKPFIETIWQISQGTMDPNSIQKELQELSCNCPKEGMLKKEKEVHVNIGLDEKGYVIAENIYLSAESAQSGYYPTPQKIIGTIIHLHTHPFQESFQRVIHSPQDLKEFVTRLRREKASINRIYSVKSGELIYSIVVNDTAMALKYFDGLELKVKEKGFESLVTFIEKDYWAHKSTGDIFEDTHRSVKRVIGKSENSGIRLIKLNLNTGTSEIIN